jgi:hypothetical protein
VSGVVSLVAVPGSGAGSSAVTPEVADPTPPEGAEHPARAAVTSVQPARACRRTRRYGSENRMGYMAVSLVSLWFRNTRLMGAMLPMRLAPSLIAIGQDRDLPVLSE